ncbi:MAG: metallopeptidase TldD-related protein [Sulfolobales archaeon]|nr:metallopeptidase TldD-related protein [Sulfolobales archaeon]MDW8083292.1 metallopeptidase TldD-related protein [Sulfolobales archaeon]
MIERRDTVTLLKRVEEVSISSSFISRRSYETSILGVRQLLGGCWFVNSCSRCSDTAKLNSELDSIVKTADIEHCSVSDSFKVDFYSGKLSLGSWVNDHGFLDSVLSLVKEHLVLGGNYTLTIRMLQTIRTIRADDGSESFEEKNLSEVDVCVQTRSGALGGIRLNKVVLLGLERSAERAFEELIKAARDRVKAIATARRPGLSDVGRAEVVLTHEASPKFFHEISHLLSGSRSRWVVGRKLFDADAMRILDSPGDIRKPTARFFDDEGVTAKRRWLVERGLVIDAHHSIITAFEADSSPGSAHGLFGDVKPFHTSLIVERGDWSDDELLEETKRGFTVDSVALVSLEENIVRIIPHYAFRLVRGDLGEAVYVRSIKIPITRPIKILGVGQTSYTTFSSEAEYSLVSESSPPVKVEAFIEV